MSYTMSQSEALKTVDAVLRGAALVYTIDRPLIDVAVDGGERVVSIELRRSLNPWAYRSSEEPTVNHLTISAGDCVGRGRYGSKRITRTVPVRKDKTLNPESVLRAVEAMIQVVREDVVARRRLAASSEAAARQRKQTQATIQHACPGLLRMAGNRLMRDGSVPLDVESGYAGLDIDINGRVEIRLRALTAEDAVTVLRALGVSSEP